MNGIFEKSLPVFWWIAVWGIVDIVLQTFAKKNNTTLLFVYGGILAVIVGLIGIKRELLEHF